MQGSENAPKPNGARLGKLEALRGFVALYVVMHHTLPHHIPVAGFDLGLILRFGQEAVILFFLLSGFVINFSFQMSRDRSWSRYLLKRALRIYTLLVPVLVLSYLCASLAEGRWLNAQLPQLIGNLLMLQDVESLKPGVLVSPYMGNSPLWSLSYEWWFYILFYPITMWIQSWRARAVSVFVLSLVATVLYTVWPTFLPRLLAYFGIWWVGVYLSELYLRGEIGRLKAWVMPIAAMAGCSALLLVGVLLYRSRGGALQIGVHPVLELRHFAFTAVVLMGAWAWRRASWLGFDRLFGPFAVLASTSYALYISHYFLLSYAGYLRFIPWPWLEQLGYCVTLAAVAYLLELKLYPAVHAAVFAPKPAAPAVPA